MDGIGWLRFLFSFALILGLIGLFALALKKWGGRFMLTLPKGTEPRLKVLEACAVGARHRLVLVKCDAREHVLLIGPETAIVVEGKPND